MGRAGQPLHVSLVAIPEAMASTISGIYEVLRSFELLGSFDDALPRDAPFQVDIVSTDGVPALTASGLPVGTPRRIAEIDRTDIVIVPSILVHRAEWKRGRYPALVSWLTEMHARGAMLCSACSGVLLIAETGLLDGREATIHWAYSRTFEHNYPEVELRIAKVLVVTGERQQLVMSGASASWHDLVLYLVARHVGPTAAQAIARFLLLQWHVDGQAPYISFVPVVDHGDAVVLGAQQWLAKHFSVASPVAEMVRRSGLAERSLKRRFTQATGYSPIEYVQRVRVEEAKRRLERTDAPIEKISWDVGYEDAASFRRLFKRVTEITAGEYRRKFQLPDFAQVKNAR